jgi:polyisoprenoid-binding protein YceI
MRLVGIACVCTVVLLAGCSWLSRSGSPADNETERSAEAMVISKEIDTESSFVVFSGQVGDESYQGKFQKIEGIVSFPEESLGTDLDGGAMEIRVPVESLQTQHDVLTARLLGAEFFDASRHPLIIFRSTKIVQLPDGVYELVGTLLMKGEQKELQMQARLKGDVITLHTIVGREIFPSENPDVPPIIPAEARIVLKK